VPQAWREGSVKGLKARGGHEVSLSWSDGRLYEASIISSHEGKCRLRAQEPFKVMLKGRRVTESKEVEIGNMIWHEAEISVLKGDEHRVISKNI
jgi:alpha-L-fucosidase 2